MLKEKWPGERELPTYILCRQRPPFFFFFLLWTCHLLTACDTLILTLEKKMNHLCVFSLMIGQISVKTFLNCLFSDWIVLGYLWIPLTAILYFWFFLVAFCEPLLVLFHPFLDFGIRAFSTDMIMFYVFFSTLFFIVPHNQFIFDHCWTLSWHFHGAIHHKIQFMNDNSQYRAHH